LNIIIFQCCVLLGGTFKALQIFKKDFRQARRAVSEGNIIWDRMDKNSDEWDFFIETLWEFQYLKEKTELTNEIKEFFYDQCQGGKKKKDPFLDSLKNLGIDSISSADDFLFAICCVATEKKTKKMNQ